MYPANAIYHRTKLTNDICFVIDASGPLELRKEHLTIFIFGLRDIGVEREKENERKIKSTTNRPHHKLSFKLELYVHIPVNC